MSNEELADKIKAGESEYIGQLWQQVEKFVRMKAREYYNKLNSSNINMFFDVEDLINESYFAMLDAVEYYDHEKGTFLKVFNFFLSKHFQLVSHLRRSESTHNYNWYSSLNKVTGTEDGEKELLEYMEDKAALQELITVEDIDLCRCARKYINKALHSQNISQKAREYIKLTYLENVEPALAQEMLNIKHRQTAHELKSKAFYIMRHGKYGMILKKLLLTFEENEVLPYQSKTERKAIQKISKEKVRQKREEKERGKEWNGFEKWLLDMM